MWIEHIGLTHFRNYEALVVPLASGKNVFVGANASGKTNILEAIQFLSSGKSRRTSVDRELIQWDQPFARIVLNATSNHHDSTVQIEAQLALTPENRLKTVFRYNKNPVRSRSDVVGKIPTVTFFLSDLLMLRGTPENRRHALDTIVSQYDPVHFKRLRLYNRIRQQKGRLLKEAAYPMDTSVLESLNQQLSQAGAAIMKARLDYLHLAQALAEVRYLELSQGRDQLHIGYQSQVDDTVDVVAESELEAQLLALMVARSHEECRRGQVLVGPHRDDVRFFLNGRDASSFGSQGQQRSIVLAVKLAEIELLEKQLGGETPVLLLDDVMAELDLGRQNQLLHHLNPDMQVLLTTTHLDGTIEPFLSSTTRLFHVDQGSVQQEGVTLEGA